MEREAKIRIGLLLQAAIQDTGAEFAEADFVFYRAKDDQLALVPVERCVIPTITEAMGEQGLDRLSVVEKVMGNEGFALLCLLAVRLNDAREPSIQHEELPGASIELIEVAKQMLWDTLIEAGKITPQSAGA